ncbi:MAG: recombinase family protein [Mycobacterium sp.]|nr:recombinase family protein [Mycobacterium sp.]
MGYARVSTIDQHPELQLDALEAAGCQRIFADHVCSVADDRPELARCLDHLREGDTLVVWRLDRLGRSVRDLIDRVAGLEQRSVGFRSLSEHIDTTTPPGKLVFHIFAAIAEFERDLIRERTAAGLAAARARGRVGGRPKALSTGQVAAVQRLYDTGELTVAEIGQIFGVSRQTIYRSLEVTKTAGSSASA